MASNSRRRKPAAAAEPSKAWLDSYADAMTLLLAFFVLLFAMSDLDVKKYEAFFEGLNGPIENASSGDKEGTIEDEIPPPASTPPEENDVPAGPAPTHEDDGSETATTTTVPDVPDLEEELYRVSLQAAEDLVAELENALAAHLDPADYSVDLEKRGVVVRLADNALFASGSADLDLSAREVISLVAVVLADGLDNAIQVEGHTDSRPTSGTKFPTNWELSTARATNVLRQLISNSDIDPARMAAVGRADTVPRASNETVDGRSENRRTEVVVEFSGLGD